MTKGRRMISIVSPPIAVDSQNGETKECILIDMTATKSIPFEDVLSSVYVVLIQNFPS